MKVITRVNIEELKTPDFIKETFCGTLAECLAWKSDKVNEFIDLVGDHNLVSIGYEEIIELGNGPQHLFDNENDTIVFKSGMADFIAIYFSENITELRKLK